MAPGSFFSGLIDDIRIYNRAVNPQSQNPIQTNLRSRQIVELPAPVTLGCHLLFFASCIENYDAR